MQNGCSTRTNLEVRVAIRAATSLNECNQSVAMRAEGREPSGGACRAPDGLRRAASMISDGTISR